MGNYVKDEKESSLFWHKLLVENGCPRNGIISIRRRTRLKYHYAIREAREKEKKLEQPEWPNLYIIAKISGMNVITSE